MISFAAFSDELQKIAGFRDRLFNIGRKLGLVESDAQSAMRTVRKIQKSIPTATPMGTPMVAGVSPQAQLQRLKLQRQLAEMKRARGLA